MNAQKFTQKSLEAIQDAQDIAIQYQNMNIEQEHLLLALVQQENGLIPQLLKKMNVNVDSVKNTLEDFIAKLPKVSGSGRQANTVYLTPNVDKTLTEAENHAKRMKD